MVTYFGNQRVRSGLFHLVVTLAAFCSADPTTADEPSQAAARVAVLKAEVADTQRAFVAAWRKLPDPSADDPEANKLIEAFTKKQLAAIDEIFAIAKADPASTGGFAALEWLLMTPRAYYTTDFPTALSQLIEHHAANPEIGKGLAIIAYYPPDESPADELTVKLFKAVIEKNPDKTARGHASLGLAWLARNTFNKADFKGSADAHDLAAVAEAQFEAVIREYGDCENLRTLGARPRTPTLRGEAETELFELRRLQVGSLAPEIEGEDIDGTKSKLSDYRGKVTLLVFWASWCSACMADVPHEKELYAHFKDRPFAVVGVNGDETREDAKTVVKKHAIPWRSFWNGDLGAGGPIAIAWNVRGWPTVYVIDHEGVIRHKYLHGEKLDKPLEELVAAAETASKPK